MRAFFKWCAAPFVDANAYDAAAVAALVAILFLALAPIVERAERVFAFFDVLERGMK